MVHLIRGPLTESVHAGHAVIADATGQIVAAWGDPGAVIFPRSSMKMIQALPMVEAGMPISSERLALACASHQGAPRHVALLQGWLDDLGAGEADLLCGSEPSRNRALRHEMLRDGRAPTQVHNQCSGKHAGFLAFARHLEAGPDYVAADHPVQAAVRERFEALTGTPVAGAGIDGCAAPAFATTVTGLATAMARFAAARAGWSPAENAIARLRDAMAAHPDLLAGEGQSVTDLVRAAGGQAIVKSGAEGVYVAILPKLGFGAALKIADGADRAAEIAMTALLVHLQVVEAADPRIARWSSRAIRNRAGQVVGQITAAPDFPT